MFRIAALAVAYLFIFSAPALAETRVINLTIENAIITNSEKTIRVNQGDNVSFVWTTDHAHELHLHGYNIKFNVKPGVETKSEFDANLVGRFPIEAHGHSHGEKEKTILYIEVYPN